MMSSNATDERFTSRLLAALVVALACMGATGCSLLVFGAVALGEARRASSPEVIAQNQMAAKRLKEQMEVIKAKADGGDGHAEIELARRCLLSGFPHYPCLVEDPVAVLKSYSDQGYLIATYYYASHLAGMDPLGHWRQGCVFAKCREDDEGRRLLQELASKGCQQRVEAYQQQQYMHPCVRLAQKRR